MKAFIYKDRTYIRLIPGKNLFKSTMVHEVVNRGDIFGMDIQTQVFTIIPGTAKVEHIILSSVVVPPKQEMKIPNSPSPLWELAKQSELDLGGNPSYSK